MRSNWNLFKIALYTLFQPTQLARELSVRCDPAVIFVYGATTKLLAGTILFITVTTTSGVNRPDTLGFAVAVGTIIAAALCEVTVATLLYGLARPRPAIPHQLRFPFWWNLVQCFSLHLPISAGLIVAEIATMPHRGNRDGYMELFLGTIGGCLIWWWCTLACAILARSTSSGGRTGAILLIPAAGVGAIIAGAVFVMLMSQ